MEYRNDEESESRRKKEHLLLRLHEEFQGIVRSTICAKIGRFNSEAVDDVAQETWGDIWEIIDKERSVKWTPAYFGTIARRRSIDWIRNSIYRQKVKDLAEYEAEAEARVYSAPHPLAIPGENGSHGLFSAEQEEIIGRLNLRIAEHLKLTIDVLKAWKSGRDKPSKTEDRRRRKAIQRVKEKFAEMSDEIRSARQGNDGVKVEKLSAAFHEYSGITINEYEELGIRPRRKDGTQY